VSLFVGNSLIIKGTDNTVIHNIVKYVPGYQEIDLTLENIEFISDFNELDFNTLVIYNSIFNDIHLNCINLKIDKILLMLKNPDNFALLVTVYNKAEIFAQNDIMTAHLRENSIKLGNLIIFKGIQETTIDLITTSLEFKLDIDRFRRFDRFNTQKLSDLSDDFKINEEPVQSILSGFSLCLLSQFNKKNEVLITLTPELIKLDSHRRITIYHSSCPIIIQSTCEKTPSLAIIPSTGVTYALQEVVFVPKKTNNGKTLIEVAIVIMLVISVFSCLSRLRRKIPNPKFELSDNDQFATDAFENIDTMDDEQNDQPDNQNQLDTNQ